MDEQKMPRRPRRSSTEEQPKNESLVYGKNPVTELLKSGSGVDTVLIAEGMAPAVAAYYTAMAKEAGATVKRVHPNKLRLMTGTESHQGVAAFASEIEYVTVEDLLNVAREKGEPPFPRAERRHRRPPQSGRCHALGSAVRRSRHRHPQAGRRIRDPHRHQVQRRCG